MDVPPFLITPHNELSTLLSRVTDIMGDIYEPLRFLFITKTLEIHEGTCEKASGMGELNILRRDRRCH
jgi:hypothetical protein